ncbi:LysR family transcriptional regulator [Bacteriovorax sp. Seq25_V]|uniref:LysR family transcriptional regulator n=1 Tax=Bacteriovorax sp. Seq25_V TaxID=1201288 RepID=UPI00038A3EA9|nr:LysR family transcriptional regulator [Bacteriovorax sp. Seq25_V]EQC45659.1 transcriptional regulator, LysR family [Bacteriovorax sp. Seq25_V]
MNLDQLQVLKIIKEEGSFSKASEKLFKAKSALSYAIQNLEDELGLLLIDRSEYRPKLTNYGLQLLEKASPVLKSFEELTTFAKTLSSNQELKIRLSMSAIFPLSEFTSTLRKIEENFLNTEVVFTTEVLSGEKFLLAGDVDISLLAGITNKVDLEYKKVGEVEMPLVIASTHPIVQKGLKPTKEVLSNYPQIVVRSTLPDESSFGVVKGSKKWYVDDLGTKMKLIMEGLGWGRLPDHIVNEYVQRQVLEILRTEEMEHEKIEMFLARRRNEYHGIVSNYIWNSF